MAFKVSNPKMNKANPLHSFWGYQLLQGDSRKQCVLSRLGQITFMEPVQMVTAGIVF